METDRDSRSQGHRGQPRPAFFWPETIGISSTSNSPRHPPLPDSINDPGLGGIVRGHLHLDLVSHHQANEPLPHLAGNMRQQFVIAGKLHLEHGPSKNSRNGALHFNGLGLSVSALPGALVLTPAPPAPAPAPSSSWWSCDNSFLGSANARKARIRVDPSLLIFSKSQSKSPHPVLIFLSPGSSPSSGASGVIPAGGGHPRGLALTPGRLAPSLRALPAPEQTLLKRL